MAQPKFEDLVKALQAANSPFDLADDIDLFKSGLLDLQNRVHVCEAFMKAHPAHPAPPPPTHPPAAPTQKA